MRIDKLLLKDFKNLVDFEVDFDEQRSRTVLVGRNGVGKTNLLEALTWIFRDIDLREKPHFGYKLCYQCNGHLIEIESTREGDSEPAKYRMRYAIARGSRRNEVPVADLSETEFYRLNAETRLLPRHIFGYYSGTSQRLTELFRKHEERYRDVLIRKGDEQTVRFLFLAKPQHSQFVLLAFYSKDEPDTRRFLKEQLGITGLDSVLFVLKEPEWALDNPSEEKRRQGDERFWFAAGKVKTLLSALYQNALAPIRRDERVPVGIRRHETKEHVYCFLRNEADVRTLAENIDQKELFRRLESTQLSDLLRRLWIFFTVDGGPEPLSFEDLSEGEQQLLTVLGLLRFTSEDESLFLLDEPDTHLNPAWCLDYLQILRDYGGGLTKSQIIMTTHSPIVFAGLAKEEVVVMHKSSDGRIFAEHPASDPKGMGFPAILMSDFFGMRSILDRETLEALEEKRRLGALENRTPAQEAKLQALNQQLRKIDFTNMSRDPLYKEFVEAMSAQAGPELKEPVLTNEQLEERRKMARETVARISKQVSKK